MAMHIFPLPDRPRSNWGTLRGGRPRKHPKPEPAVVRESFWLGVPRAGFTDRAAEYFHVEQTIDTMPGVTLLAAKKHGLL